MQSATAWTFAAPAGPTGREGDAAFAVRRRAGTFHRKLARVPYDGGAALAPVDFVGGKEPGAAFVVVALHKEVRPAVGVGEDAGVTRLARVPISGLAVGNEGFAMQPRPVQTIGAGGAANLLRVVVVAAAIEEIERIPTLDHRGGFDAAGLPRQFRLENGAVTYGGPRIAAKVALQVGRRSDEHLRLHRGIARGVDEPELAVKREGVAVDRAPGVPVACGTQDGIAGIARELQPIVGSNVAEGIVLPVPVGVVEQVNLAAKQQGWPIGYKGKCELRMVISLTTPAKRGDATNYAKQVEDAIEAAGLVANDNQIVAPAPLVLNGQAEDYLWAQLVPITDAALEDRATRWMLEAE